MNIIIDAGYKPEKTNRLIKRNISDGIALPDLIVSTGITTPGKIQSKKVSHGSPITKERLEQYKLLTPTSQMTLLRVPNHIKTPEEAQIAGFHNKEFIDFLKEMIENFPNLRIYSTSAFAQTIIGTQLLTFVNKEKHLVLPVETHDRTNHEFYFTSIDCSKITEIALRNGKNVICEYDDRKSFDANKMVLTNHTPFIAARKKIDSNLWVVTSEKEKTTERVSKYIKAYNTTQRR